MRKHLLGLMLIAGLAGCSSESDVGSADGVMELADSEAAPGLTSTSLAAQRASMTSFASLPDRGELLAYGGARKVRESGAYTWHPVSISEEHALNAIGGGRLVVNTPTGEALNLHYERHEEQADGNWTWVGRSPDGGSAVLTFGQTAVFGTITRGNEAYRVRTDRTGAWVVETDPRLVAARAGGAKDNSDTLAPPETRALMVAASQQLAKSPVSEEAVAAKAAGVIDLLVGYSNTIATELGSQSAAVTLMSNLAAMANAAYANSGVNMRLRLVHTLPVTYGDTTPNSEALRQLTGYDSETGQPITPNSAFSALRSARNEYGADLVAFVRRYRDPEQEGCGVAWLLGANQSAITASKDAEFGYAVVSDGEDYREGSGDTYFCSDYALAHELGHLMGQVHNSENAPARGAHAYSYGYREAATFGFFTIMAYPLSGGAQIEIPYFGNPSVTYLGRPTGTASADNVRSMNQTMPIISTFRATVVPLREAANDFNGDGISDIFWRNSATGQNQIWFSANNSTQTALPAVGGGWRVVGIGDFNGDGISDILWRHADGRNTVWRSGNSATQTPLATVGSAWQVAGVGDFNGDGVSDILWRNIDGRNTIWRSGNNATQTSVVAVGVAWRVGGIGDFNGDNVDDILWRSTDGRNTIWLAASNATQSTVAAVGDAWSIVGIGDFDGDGRSDILWRSANGTNTIWRSGNNATQTSVAMVGTAWQIAGVGDFNGDGISDILWRRGDGANTIWRSANNATQTAVSAVNNLAWQVMPLH